MKISKSLLTIGLALACAALTFSLAVCAEAQTFTSLATFNGQDGFAPWGSVTQGINGHFYGTAGLDGAHQGGNVFEVSPDGTLRIIHSFCSQANCADGYYPTSAPVLGSDGNLYGVVGEGGSDAGYGTGAGVFYKITSGQQFTILYTFCATTPCVDGAFPTGLTLASDGNFYGTTYAGGTYDGGTIFQVTPAGQLKVLYDFCSHENCIDGWHPVFPPIQGSDGNFYGTTPIGGTPGSGVFYELTDSGTYKVLHNFCQTASCSDGSVPNSIAQDAKGDFFGSASSGGSKGYGTIFQITPANQFTVLHNFDFEHEHPLEQLILANDGNLYATTQGDAIGTNGGSILEITPSGTVTQLYLFSNGPCDGSNPSSLLFQGTDGRLYGTTVYGGAINGRCGGDGTVFSLSNGLSPLVETAPRGGKVGTQVIILGNNLTGSSSVTFNGVAAAFTVESDTYIKATVPSGATTGIVSVVTPSGTLNSNPQFVVTH
jgi:uncharacterized repeat protein (TIGR03803 family)